MKKLMLYVVGVFFVSSLLNDFAYARGGGHRSSGRSYSSRSKSSYKSGSVHVSGYRRKNGNYVQSHHRTRANSTKRDNWSTRGNVNPYTGKAGTVDP